MKYVRTKYGIKLNITTNKIFIVREGNVYEVESNRTKKLPQANTIQELCDEFVFITENLSSGGYWIIRTYQRAKEIARSYKEDGIKFSCYGSIWTNRGLIYAAKMNYKGELKLL